METDMGTCFNKKDFKLPKIFSSFKVSGEFFKNKVLIRCYRVVVVSIIIHIHFL